MASHTLYCDHYGVDVPQLAEIICNVCGESYPCPTRQKYNEEMLRRFLEKRKQPVRIEHGRHSTEGPRDWKS
ncbi:hypothetical protein SEA_MOLIVIA_9 [Arthrobacter phage Molivia]|uniref:Uncharacterized protein n=1 Tax=Arthrobacter phage Molivia TaxID=2015839 RepID=A0A286N4D1_9CAUD|nr:hypothetical protein FDI28_gp09 [Arthrobacter phage Molivia]ASX99238.1 hypothetical protein SEA_MOLIVIA_9 [Arthrobacter phage Molivia]